MNLQFFNLKDIDQSQLADILNWLIDLNKSGKWVAVNLLNISTEKISIEDKVLFPVAKNLLMKEGILADKNINIHLVLHQYVLLLKKIDSLGLDNELIAFISTEILEASKEISLNHDYQLKEILELLIDINWEVTWDVFGTVILSQGFYAWFNIRGLLRRVKSFDVNKLLDWVDQNPKLAPQKAIDFIELTRQEEGRELWSETVITLLDRYSENESVFEVLSSRFYSFSWSGSLVPLYESKKQLMKLLADHEKAKVRDFAKSNISILDKKIELEKRNDENRNLEF